MLLCCRGLLVKTNDIHFVIYISCKSGYTSSSLCPLLGRTFLIPHERVETTKKRSSVDNGCN